jgi:hypothetical protein
MRTALIGLAAVLGMLVWAAQGSCADDAKAKEKAAKHVRNAGEQVFGLADVNKDKKLHLPEFNNAMAIIQKTYPELLKEVKPGALPNADQNQDGAVSREEFGEFLGKTSGAGLYQPKKKK